MPNTSSCPAPRESCKPLLDYFRREMGSPQTELHWQTPFQLLVAVVLSAQCTDKRINLVTPPLFETYPTPEALAQATPDDVLRFIHSVSYPNAKAKHLVALAQKLVSDFHGRVPDDIDSLTSLPGVGRKTANVILSVVFRQPAMAVDTHIFRVSHRLGLVPPTATTPRAVEQALTQLIPPADIPDAHHWLLLHGRYVCTARKPHCHDCGLRQWCPTHTTMDTQGTPTRKKP